MPDQDTIPEIDLRWSDALLAAQVLAAGAGLIGGIRLRAGAGPVRDRWLEMARVMMAARAGKSSPWIRVSRLRPPPGALPAASTLQRR
jgi:magnesium chelatase subunit D